jgi:lycopene cyclase domain-containing protein
VNYLEINMWFIGGVFALALVAWFAGVRPRLRGMLGAFVVVGALTAVFDNAIIGAGIVAYDESTLTGIMVGLAPIEDFFYTLAGAILIPVVWEILGGAKKARS